MTSLLIAAAIVFLALASSACLFVPMLQRECAVTRRRDLFLAGEGGLELAKILLRDLLERAMILNLSWFLLLSIVAACSAAIERGTNNPVTNGLMAGFPATMLALPGLWHALFQLAARDLNANREVRSVIGAHAMMGAVLVPMIALGLAAFGAVVVSLIFMILPSGLSRIIEPAVTTLFLLSLGWLAIEYMIPFRSWNALKRAYPYREEPEVSR